MIHQIRLPIWEQYSKKVQARIQTLRYAGYLNEVDGVDSGMRFVRGFVENPGDGIWLCLYWWVDELDGVIADAKFQALGPTALIAVVDATCELLLRKNFSQASRLSAELVERHLRDRKDKAALPDICLTHLNTVMEAIDRAVQQCAGISCEIDYQTPIASTHTQEDELRTEIEGWEQLSDENKLEIIDKVIANEILPYIELDAGGVTVLGLRENHIVRISYQGSCTSCPSATGSTLAAIQRILQSQVHHTLIVLPE